MKRLLPILGKKDYIAHFEQIVNELEWSPSTANTYFESISVIGLLVCATQIVHLIMAKFYIVFKFIRRQAKKELDHPVLFFVCGPAYLASSTNGRSSCFTPHLAKLGNDQQNLGKLFRTHARRGMVLQMKRSLQQVAVFIWRRTFTSSRQELHYMPLIIYQPNTSRCSLLRYSWITLQRSFTSNVVEIVLVERRCWKNTRGVAGKGICASRDCTSAERGQHCRCSITYWPKLLYGALRKN